MTNLVPSGGIPISLDYDNQQIRVVDLDGEPWFVAVDVCAVLGLRQPARACKAIPSCERGVTSGNPQNGWQDIVVVNEAGLWRLVCKSRKPEARKFQNWLFNEVVPSIRKHGCYPPPLTTAGDRALVQIDTHELAREFGIVLRQTVSEMTEPLATKEQVEDLRSDVYCKFEEIERKLPNSRKRLTIETQRHHLVVVHAMYGGKCPCCKHRLIVHPETGDKLPSCQFDHWELRSKNQKHETWAVCDECNQKMKTEWKATREVHFRAYQQTRVEYEQLLNPTLPGITW